MTSEASKPTISPDLMRRAEARHLNLEPSHREPPSWCPLCQLLDVTWRECARQHGISSEPLNEEEMQRAIARSKAEGWVDIVP